MDGHWFLFQFFAIYNGRSRETSHGDIHIFYIVPVCYLDCRIWGSIRDPDLHLRYITLTSHIVNFLVLIILDCVTWENNVICNLKK